MRQKVVHLFIFILLIYSQAVLQQAKTPLERAHFHSCRHSLLVTSLIIFVNVVNLPHISRGIFVIYTRRTYAGEPVRSRASNRRNGCALRRRQDGGGSITWVRCCGAHKLVIRLVKKSERPERMTYLFTITKARLKDISGRHVPLPPNQVVDTLTYGQLLVVKKKDNSS